MLLRIFRKFIFGMILLTFITFHPFQFLLGAQSIVAAAHDHIDTFRDGYFDTVFTDVKYASGLIAMTDV